MSQTHALETQPVRSLITKLALPTVVTMVLTGVTNMATTFFAIPLGQEAVAVVGIVFSALSFMQAIGYTVALGGSTLLSPLLSHGDDPAVPQYAAATVWLDLLLGILIGLAGFVFTPRLMSLLGAAPDLVPLAASYARPIFIASPLVCVNYGFTCLLRCVNRSGKAMLGMVIGGGLTLGLTPLLMFTAGLGVQGGGIAFLAGQGISFGILLVCFAKAKPLSLSPALLPKTIKIYLQIPYYGISSLVRQGLAAVSLVLLNRRAAAYGTELIAALSLVSRITGLLYSALLGWGQGFTPVAGYAFGKGNGKRIQKALSFALQTATMAMTGFSVVLLGLPFWFHNLHDPYSNLCLYSQALSLPFIPLGVLTTMAYQSVKRPLVATLLSGLRQGLCFIPLLFVLPLFLEEKGLLITQGVADLLTFLLAFYPYVRLKLAFRRRK